MTLPRGSILKAHPDGVFHCMSRCVRRAYLCGYDRSTGVSYAHRRHWIEARLELIASSFAVSIHAYSIMENHFHVVLQMDSARASTWSDREVATRWLAVYPGRVRSSNCPEAAIESLLADPERIATYRSRLSSLSWFMRSLKEYIARRANREDGCTGHFWEGRFKSQAVLDESSLYRTMTYVDLNPIRAGIATEVGGCEFTSGRVRKLQMTRVRDPANEPLMPVLGVIFPMSVSLEAYVTFLESCAMSTGPKVVHQWRRAIGSLQSMRNLAARLGQRWVRGGDDGAPFSSARVSLGWAVT
jgi:REP element-mobilizing transposase RayT